MMTHDTTPPSPARYLPATLLAMALLYASGHQLAAAQTVEDAAEASAQGANADSQNGPTKVVKKIEKKVIKTVDSDTGVTEIIEIEGDAGDEKVTKHLKMGFEKDGDSAGSASAVAEFIPPHVAERLDPDGLLFLLKERQQAEFAREGREAEHDMVEATVVPLAVFGFTFLSIAIIAFFRFREKTQLHETIRDLAEKGQELPLNLLEKPKPPNSDLRKGVLLIAIGGGIAGAIATLSGGEGAGIGVVPILLGMGYLITWKLEKKL